MTADPRRLLPASLHRHRRDSGGGGDNRADHLQRQQRLPFQTLFPAEETGLHVDSKAQAEQVRSVAIERVGAVVGTVPLHLMELLDDALRLHLDL